MPELANQQINLMIIKSQFKRTIILLVLAILNCFNCAFPQQSAAESSAQDIPEGVFNYVEKDGNKVIPFNWKAELEEKGVSITVHEQGKYFYNLCTTEGETLIWHIQVEGKHNLRAVRKDDYLHIQGTRFGKEYRKTIPIDERPWYQPLSFSLGHFLNSNEKKTSFWIIRADKIEVIALSAKKMGVENVLFAGAKVPAQKIEVRAEGFYSNFWHATYWYRKSDNLFLRYESVHGLPGSEETIVELIKTPDQRLTDS